MAECGILGGRDELQNESFYTKLQLKRRERWLVVLGIVLHAVYMLSIFDIYFKSPIVHGMEPVSPRIKAPAKRLVLLIADGLRADKFFEPDSEGEFRAPFLRSIIQEKGRWGISHARPPTESRPGHVAIIAGFYEDPSAVTKGWKANPVEFDSVFNRSKHTIAFGSPDIIPIFCGALSHSTWSTYPHEFEDFASDASFLDQWSYDQFHDLLNTSKDSPKLKKILLQDNLVIFLHLLGCDTNGHAHRPYSDIYLNNVKIVDKIAEKVYNLVESYFGDNRTAYIFTADHGMSDKGSHGDGHPTNTDTPLVAWGAGVKNPKIVQNTPHIDDGFHFIDDHTHDMPTPTEWNLKNFKRVDVNQADISPLMATLLGLPCPVNSVGNLPLGYIHLSEVEEVEAVLANAKQVLNQFLQKSQIKQANSLNFKSFKPLENSSLVLGQIENLISTGNYQDAMKLSQSLRSLSLEGLHYFQTYDWLMLMTTVTLGYVGWMINLLFHVLRSYTSLHLTFLKMKVDMVPSKNGNTKVNLIGCFVMGIRSYLLFLEKCPLLYHAYSSMTLFLWTQLFNDVKLLNGIWRVLSNCKKSYVVKLLICFAVSLFILEFLVSSFSERKLYTWCFLIAGVGSGLFIFSYLPHCPGISLFTLVSFWSLSLFTLMPAEIPENTTLVIASGFLVTLIGVAGRWFDLTGKEGTEWANIVDSDNRQSQYAKLFYLQAILVALSSAMVWISTSHRTQKRELLTLHQLINWFLACISMIVPLFSPPSILSRLSSIFLGFAPPFLLLSVGYESIFYGVFALVLMSWILIECVFLNLEKYAKGFTPTRNYYNTSAERWLQLSDLRIPLIFMVLFNVAFFGTGNFASIASFEISSVYRFITIFSPFLMSALLIFKLFIPFMLVICVFSAITKLICVPRLSCYFLVIIFSNVMTIHFFFLVRNTGSWMEIGNSISHFGIMSAQVIFILFLFAVTNIYTRDIEVFPSRSSRKNV